MRLLLALVAIVAVSWTAPTRNVDNTPLTDLAGYELATGPAQGEYVSILPVGNVTETTVSVPSPGRTFMAVRAVDTSGNRSDWSNEVAAQVPAGPAITTGGASAHAGQTIDLPIDFTAGDAVSAAQFDLTFPASVTFVSAAPGAAATAAGKSISTSPVGASIRFLAFGLNANSIGSGTLATVRVGVASGAAPGPLPVSIGGLSFSSPAGTEVNGGATGGVITIMPNDTPQPTPSNVPTPTPGATISPSRTPTPKVTPTSIPFTDLNACNATVRAQNREYAAQVSLTARYLNSWNACEARK